MEKGGVGELCPFLLLLFISCGAEGAAQNGA